MCVNSSDAGESDFVPTAAVKGWRKPGNNGKGREDTGNKVGKKGNRGGFSSNFLHLSSQQRMHTW